MNADYFHRVFSVGDPGECVEIRVSHQVSAAYDVLTDAGYSPAKAADRAASFERHGYDPEAMARKMVKLQQALR